MPYTVYGAAAVFPTIRTRGDGVIIRINCSEMAPRNGEIPNTFRA